MPGKYLRQRKAEIDTWRTAERETWTQYLADTLILTLNDPEVMGRDVFGSRRIRKVFSAWGKTQSEYLAALGGSDEADYWQEKLDAGLKKVLGTEDFSSFASRYAWIRQSRY